MTGAAPSVAANDRDGAKNAAARAAIDVRRSAAERIVAEFAGSEHEAAAAFEEAQASVSAAIQVVMRAEASAIAEEWAALEEKARALRARLGNSYAEVSKLGRIDDAVSKAISRIDRENVSLAETVSVTNSWTDFAAELARNPDAKLTFLSPEQVRDREREKSEREIAALYERISPPVAAEWLEKARDALAWGMHDEGIPAGRPACWNGAPAALHQAGALAGARFCLSAAPPF
jgi:hypothetical protein